MKHQILIEELMSTESNVIVESRNEGKQLYLNGILMQSTVKNRNGRVYPIQEIQNAVVSAQQMIKEQNGVWGELEHPSNLNINLDRVSHVITEMRMEGNNAVGKIRILGGPDGTPMGRIAEALIKSGVKIGVSSRGAGTVTEAGDVSSFSFCTIDLVAKPSAPNALPSSVYESLNNDKDGYKVLTLADQLRDDPKAQKYFKDMFMKVLSTGLFTKK